MTVKLLLVKSENGLETRQDYDGLSANNPTFTGVLTGASAALTGGVDAGGEVKSGALVGTGARPVVALADGTIDDQPPATFLGTIGALAASLKGAANGVAELGSDGRVPLAQLPSYVDEVVEYPDFASFPTTGENGKIYVAIDDGTSWRWSGTIYVQISSSLTLGSTASTAHRGDHGVIAYGHSQLTTGNPHGTTAAQVGAEPYAGVPAATSFWRSTAAGVRAWVQLVAADITDLATTLAGYLTKLNPTYTGRLTGPTQYLEADEQILLAIRRPAVGPQGGRIHGVAFHAQTLDGTWREFGRTMAYIGNNTDAAWTGGMRLMAYKEGVIVQAADASADAFVVPGTLQGSRAIFSEFGTLAAMPGDSNYGTLHAVGVTRTGTNYSLRIADDGSSALLNGSATAALAVGGTTKVGVTASEMNLASGMALKLNAVTVVDSSRNITGATLKGGNLAGPGIRPLVAGADGTIDDQDAATFRGTIGAGTSNLALGETSATAYRGDRGKTAYDHSQATGNPHSTTAADVGAMAATDPVFTGALKQGGTTRITSGGGGWFASMQATNLVGAGDRPVAADLTGTLQPKTPEQFRNMIFALAASLKGSANGVAELGADVKVPVAQLPSAALLALGADSTTAHRGDHGTTAYTHSQATGNPHGTTAADVGAAKAPSKVDVSASTTLGAIDASAIKVTTTDVILTLSGGVDGQGWDIINPTASTGIAIPSGATLWKSIGSNVGPTTIALGGGRPIRITRIDANTWTMLGSQ